MEKKQLNHLAIIMDGNGRWAISRGLRRSEGHKAGAKNLKELCNFIFEQNIPYFSIFALSTENLKREEEEVSSLMKLFITYFTNEFSFLLKKNVRILFSGRRENLPQSVLNSMDEMTKKSQDNTGAVFNICLNYGGKAEITDMVSSVCSSVVNGDMSISDIDESVVSRHLYNELPDVDFVIRTSGEMRISNFMLIQCAYAEYYFPEVLFPDFNSKLLAEALDIYKSRNRRFGGVDNEEKGN